MNVSKGPGVWGLGEAAVSPKRTESEMIQTSAMSPVIAAADQKANLRRYARERVRSLVMKVNMVS